MSTLSHEPRTERSAPTASASPAAPAPRRVLMVAYTFPPATSVGVFRVLRFVKYLPERGWQPLVLTVDPAARNERVDPALAAQVPLGTRVERVWPVRPDESLKRWFPFLGRRAKTAAAAARATTGREDIEPMSYAPGSIPLTWRRRIGDLLFATPDDKVGWAWSGWSPACRLIRRERPAVIYATGPPFTAHLLAALASWRTGVPLVLDFRDPWSRCPWGPRKDIPSSQRMLVRLEAWCVRRARRVVLNTERLCQEFRGFYPGEPAEKFLAISNGYDPALAAEVERLTAQPAAAEPGPPVLLHPGSLYLKRDPRPVLAALAELKQQGLPVRFVQLGPCDPAFRAAERASELGLADLFRQEPAVPHQQLLGRMHAAQLFLLVQPGTALQIPGKLFEMLLFGKPIVTLTDEGETADLVRQYELGPVARLDEPREIAAAIRAALAPASGVAPPARAAAVAAFDGRALAQRLADVFEAAAGQTTSASREPLGTG